VTGEEAAVADDQTDGKGFHEETLLLRNRCPPCEKRETTGKGGRRQPP
jgi:hypothetical protein